MIQLYNIQFQKELIRRKFTNKSYTVTFWYKFYNKKDTVDFLLIIHVEDF